MKIKFMKLMLYVSLTAFIATGCERRYYEGNERRHERRHHHNDDNHHYDRDEDHRNR